MAGRQDVMEAIDDYQAELLHREINQPRSLQFRIQNLENPQKNFICAILERGCKALDSENQELLKPFINKVMQMNDFVDNTSLLRSILGRITSCTNLESLISKVNAEVPVLVNAENCFYWVYDENTQTFWTLNRYSKETRFSYQESFFNSMFLWNEKLVLNSPEQAQEKCLDLGLDFKVTSLMAYPVLSQDSQNILGVVQVTNSCTGKFTYDDEYLCELILPAIASLTGKNLSTYSVFTINRMLEELLSCSIATLSAASLKEVVLTAQSYMTQIFNTATARICLLKDQKIIIFEEKDTVLNYYTGITGHVIRSRISEYIKDPYNDSRYNSICDLETTLPICFIPLLHQSDLVGVLQIPWETNKPHKEVRQNLIMHTLGNLLGEASVHHS